MRGGGIHPDIVVVVEGHEVRHHVTLVCVEHPGRADHRPQSDHIKNSPVTMQLQIRLMLAKSTSEKFG